MHRTPSTQSDRSLLDVCATSALAVGMVVCLASTAQAFSVGPLPGVNCKLIPPCSLVSALVQYEEVHQKSTDNALREVHFTPPSGGASVLFSPGAMLTIRDFNARTDYVQGDHELHFDNAFLHEGGNRLIKGKESLVTVLGIRSTLGLQDVINMRKLLGWYLHTLQDFYAHSNYVSLHNPPNIRLGDVPFPSQPDFSFPCVLPGTLSDNGTKDLLTTGWVWGPLVAELAPPGQCAHGFLLGGIHKDWFSRSGHIEAYGKAKAASVQFVNSIVNDPSIINKDNVCLFMSDKPCDNPSDKPTCPDLEPNITALAGTIGEGFYDSVSSPSLSYSFTERRGTASFSATGSKGSLTISGSLHALPKSGLSPKFAVGYSDRILITNPAKTGQYAYYFDSG